MRVGLVAGAAAVVLVVAGVVGASLLSSAGTTTPAGRTGPRVVVGSQSASTNSPGSKDAPGMVASRTTAPLVPGTSGDRYAHNVAAGAACSPVGALGFTAQVRPLRCTTITTDQPRWRAP
jgi:hypothetical protein